jgi:hypothetical protein
MKVCFGRSRSVDPVVIKIGVESVYCEVRAESLYKTDTLRL